MHEWSHTFIKFMAGNKVTTPAMVREAPKTIRPNDREKIHEWFNEAFS